MFLFLVFTKPEVDKRKVIFSNMKDRSPRVLKTEAETKTSVPVTDLLETIFNVLNRDQRTILIINRNERRKLSSHRADELNSFSVGSLPRTSDKLRGGGYDDHVFESSFHLLNSSGRFFNKTTTWNREWNRNRNRNRDFTKRRFHHFDGLISRLGEVFIVGVCLLAIVRVPVVMSAPSIRHIKASETIHTPKSSVTHSHREEALSYRNPCGKNHVVDQDYGTTPGEIDEEFFKRILIDTRNALSYTLSFRDRYVLETFQLPFEEHHNQWKNHSYDWLPNDSNEIPKKLGNKVDRLHLDERSLDEFLVKIYEYLQKFAIALEQVVLDQKRLNGDFAKNFGRTEIYLRNVLCGILMAMNNRNVTPEGHVPRSIMKDDIRQMETPSHRNLRDWLIFRDLMNSLEYMIDVFTFIDKNLPKSSAASLSSSS